MPRPDEGLIHAWLDGQLPPDEAARIESLVASDPAWAAAVAEARGLVAASSRILSALDRVPADVMPRGTVSRTMRLPWWTKIAAAVVVFVGGSVVVMQNTPDARVSTAAGERDSAQPAPDRPTATAQAPVAVAPVPTSSPKATARVPAATPAIGALADAGGARGDTPARGREARAVLPVTPPSSLALSVGAVVADQGKTAQDAERVVAEVSTAKAAAKAARSAASSAAPQTQQMQQVQQAPAQGFAQAQNTAPSPRVLAGVVVAARDAIAQSATRCYRLVPDSARAGVAVTMRVERADGDTLRLVPLESNVSQRAWLVLGNGLKGVMITSSDLRSAVPVVATATICPAP